jgi:hypothetical protein
VHFLFPAHPFKPMAVDDTFADQWAAVQAAGFTTSTVPDAVFRQGRPLRSVPAGGTVVYRGWMLDAADYARLADAVIAASAALLVPPAAYLAAHHLPNWYPLIAEFTPETRVLSAAPTDAPAVEAELRALGWDAFFVKDYVKSLKTARGSVVRDPAEIGTVVAEMIRVRGAIEGGLCVRRVEPLLPDAERRYFVLGGTPHAAAGDAVPPVVETVARRIPSPFFSVDVARRADGALRVVEVGDGQVSDLVGWAAVEFAALWGRDRIGG